MNKERSSKAWNWLPPRPPRRKRAQGGFVAMAAAAAREPERQQARRARVEQEARQAMREWLML